MELSVREPTDGDSHFRPSWRTVDIALRSDAVEGFNWIYSSAVGPSYLKVRSFNGHSRVLLVVVWNLKQQLLVSKVDINNKVICNASSI